MVYVRAASSTGQNMKWVNFLENILLTKNLFCFDWLHLCVSSILSKRDGFPKTILSYVLYQLFLEPGSFNLINCSPNFCHKCNYKSLNLSLNLLTIFTCWVHLQFTIYILQFQGNTPDSFTERTSRFSYSEISDY
jgi:hypothetical protein